MITIPSFLLQPRLITRRLRYPATHFIIRVRNRLVHSIYNKRNNKRNNNYNNKRNNNKRNNNNHNNNSRGMGF